MSYFDIIDESTLRYTENGFKSKSDGESHGYLIKELDENHLKKVIFKYECDFEPASNVYFIFGSDIQKEKFVKVKVSPGLNNIKIDLTKKIITGQSGKKTITQIVESNVRSIKFFGFVMENCSMSSSLPETVIKSKPQKIKNTKRSSSSKSHLICLFTKNSEKELPNELRKIEKEFHNYGLMIIDLDSKDATYDIIKSYNSTAEFYHYLQFEPPLFGDSICVSDVIDRVKELTKSFEFAFSSYVIYKDITVKNTKHKIQSFCTVATSNCKVEASILVKSLRRFHEEPIYIVCDSETKKFLEIEGYENVHYRPIMPKEKLKSIKEKLFSKLFYNDKQFHKPECILHKMDAMDFAFEHYENTFFLDADVIVLQSLQENFHKDIALSPHFYQLDKIENSFKYGIFNAGYIFCADKSFPEYWRHIYLNRSTFFEQEGLNHVLENYDIQTFSNLHNFGFWSKHKPSAETKSFHVHTVEKEFNGVKELQEANEKTKKILLKHLHSIGDKNFSKYIVQATGKDWGGMDTNLNLKQSNALGKINISNQQVFWHHRSGWNYAIQSLTSLHNGNGILFDGFLEKNFGWWYEDNLTSNKLPYQSPWVGFFHNPPEIPDWFFYENSVQEIINKPAVKESLENCLGIFALSEYHGEWLRKTLNKPVSVLSHPSEIPENIFSFQGFLKNGDKKIVTIGYWLRKLNSIYQLPIKKSDGFTKARLIPYSKKLPKSKIEELIEIEKESYNLKLDPTYEQNTTTLERLPDKEYDNLLTNNIVFLDLYDSSANNAIIECIARATPILVNPIPAVVEYLGEDYPFYFESLEEAAGKAKDFNLIKNAHEYILNCEMRKKLSGDFFRESFEKSEVYNLL